MSETKPEAIITILLVEDIPETRENMKKLLGFERDFKVVGLAGTGHEGLALAKELRPDIVLMDINLPDMDGLETTTLIVDSVPSAGIIILSARDDHNHIRLAMLAGAKSFLTKPAAPEELYNTVRAVYKRAPVIQPDPIAVNNARPLNDVRDRAGNVIIVYSPQGGVGCTTIATNLAAGLTHEDVRVLLVDANLQFGDVGVFLDLPARSTLADLVEDVDDLDTDFFEDIVLTHQSGLKVLLGPAHPGLAEKAIANPLAVAKILSRIRWRYDFVVVDTSLNLDEMNLALMDLATYLVLVSTPTLTSIKNVHFVLDVFAQIDYPLDKVVLILNRVSEDRNLRRFMVSPDKIVSFLKRPIQAVIPADEELVLDAMRKGIPVVISQRDRSKSPIKELLDFSNFVYDSLMKPEPEKV